MRQILGRELEPGASFPEPLSEKERAYLLETAEEFYWNELEWEKLTEEERLDQESFADMAFPGFLAFVRGLLLDEAQPDSQAPPQPRPEVVADILGFLARRVVELEEEAHGAQGDEQSQREAELKMTSRLVDLVLYIYYRLDREEANRVETGSSAEA